MSYYLNNLFDDDGFPKPFSKAPRLTVYKRELYDCAECINLCLLLRRPFPAIGTTLENSRRSIFWKTGSNRDGSFRSRQLHLGWDNVPMHRWAQSQMFRSLAFYLREALRATSDTESRAQSAPVHQLSTLSSQPLNRMCGICGQFNFQRRSQSSRRRSGGWRAPSPIADRMMKAYFISGPVGLGFRRLSIIDLAGGHQPMSDAEETVWVIFNGEIYNFKELRAELESTGHRFGTNSDTEVIVHGYKEWGTGRLQSSQWHVWSGHLGCEEEAAGRGARRHGHQTDLLPDRRRAA